MEGQRNIMCETKQLSSIQKPLKKRFLHLYTKEEDEERRLLECSPPVKIRLTPKYFNKIESQRLRTTTEQLNKSSKSIVEKKKKESLVSEEHSTTSRVTLVLRTEAIENTSTPDHFDVIKSQTIAIAKEGGQSKEPVKSLTVELMPDSEIRENGDDHNDHMRRIKYCSNNTNVDKNHFQIMSQPPPCCIQQTLEKQKGDDSPIDLTITNEKCHNKKEFKNEQNPISLRSTSFQGSKSTTTTYCSRLQYKPQPRSSSITYNRVNKIDNNKIHCQRLTTQNRKVTSSVEEPALLNFSSPSHNKGHEEYGVESNFQRIICGGSTSTSSIYLNVFQDISSALKSDSHGNFPIHWSVIFGKREAVLRECCILFLLKTPIDQLLNAKSMTALQLAICCETSCEIIATLLDFGCNPSTADKLGRDCFDVAHSKHLTNIHTLLLHSKRSEEKNRFNTDDQRQRCTSSPLSNYTTRHNRSSSASSTSISNQVS